MKDIGFRFTWGDTVRVREEAPSPYRAGAYASVCGRGARPDGTREYTIEYDDGSSHEISEDWLEGASNDLV